MLTLMVLIKHFLLLASTALGLWSWGQYLLPCAQSVGLHSGDEQDFSGLKRTQDL
jgi:hypothetical protein